MSRLAIFLPNWVGDAVMATPALRTLRQTYSQTEIIGVMGPVIADVLAGTGLLDQTILYQPRGKNRDHSSWSVVQKLRGKGIDAALLLTNSWRSAILAWLSGARRRIGFARDGRSWLLSDPVEGLDRRLAHPVLDDYLTLTSVLGCPRDDNRMELVTQPMDETRLDAFLSYQPRSFGQPDLYGRKGYVCFNSGGAFGPAKNWPVESFAKLAQRLVDEQGESVIVVAGPQERDNAREIVRLARRANVVTTAGEVLSIGMTKSVIARSKLLVTTDSGPRHFAGAFQIPTVTIFGPTDPRWSHNYATSSVDVRLAVECSPCQKRTCPLRHHRCMTELKVEQVLASCRQLLEGADLQKLVA